MRRKKLLSVWAMLLIIVRVILPEGIYAQSPTGPWVYTVVSTTDSFDLFKVNSRNSTSQQIYSVSKQSVEVFGTFLPKDEIQAAKDYMASRSSTDQQFNSLLTTQLSATIRSMSVAPNNQDVALNVTYQACVRNPTEECFGTSQIVLVSGANKNARIFWSLGFHSVRYLPKTCIISPVRYVNINDIRWTRDGRAVLISEGGDAFCFEQNTNIPVIVIPIVDGSKAFTAGEAIAWAISGDSHTLATVVRDCTKDCVDSLNFIDFDLATQKTTMQNYSIGLSAMVPPQFGIGFVGKVVIFHLYDWRKEGAASFAIFDITQSPSLSASPIEVGTKTIRFSPDNQRAIVESQDGSLWKVTITGKTIHTELFIQGPVASWHWGSDKTFLVQFKGDNAYTVIDEQGKTVRKIDVMNQVKSVQAPSQANANTQIEFVDW